MAGISKDTLIKISFSSILVLILITTLFLWETKLEDNKFSGVIFIKDIQGCAEAGNTNTRSNGPQEPQNATIGIDRDNVIYNRATNHLCCRKVDLKKEITDNNITIYEYWTGEGCRCVCFSKITAELKRVPPGKYTISVYKTGLKPGLQEPMEDKLIIKKTVTIKNSQ